MATSNEIAAFEDFKFQIGDMVRSIAERIGSEVTVKEAERIDADVEVTPAIGMVVSRSLGQDEAGISRFYGVKAMGFYVNLKEFEIERVSR